MASLSVIATAEATAAPIHVWTDQFGTVANDIAAGVAVSDEAVFVVGWTSGSLDGSNPPLVAGGEIGHSEAFIRRFDLDGDLVWGDQFRVGTNDRAKWVAVRDGRVLVIGETGDVLPDVIVRFYDLDRNPFSTVLLSRPDRQDHASSVAVLEDRIFVGGLASGEYTGVPGGNNDGYVSGYDLDGNLLWRDQFGDVWDEGVGSVAVDDGRVYAAGTDWRNGAFLRTYDTDGNLVRESAGVIGGAPLR